MASVESLTGKNIVITGAAQGIGRAAAERALELGANVIAVDLNGKGLDTLAANYDSGRIMPLVGNVADAEFVQQGVAQAIEKYGALHGLVNNAGISRPAMIEKMSLEDWHQVIDVHLNGAFYFLQAVGRHMIKRAKAGEENTGSIVNISSDAGRRGAIGQINYGAAKSAMLGLTMSAAREWAKYGIRVNTIMFGMVVTAMTETIRSEKFRDKYLPLIPMGRWGTTEECVKPVCYLLSDEASYVTGQHLSVNGGYVIGI